MSLVKKPCQKCHGTGKINVKVVGHLNKPHIRVNTCHRCDGAKYVFQVVRPIGERVNKDTSL